MIKETFLKVPNGKFANLKLELDGGIILKTIITGDFFLFPENVIEKIEKVISKKVIPIDTKKLTEEINNVLKDNNAKLVGISPEQISLMVEELTK